MASLVLKRGEAKTVPFNYTNGDGSSIDVSGAVLTFAMARYVGAEPLFVKEDNDFDKTQAEDGVVVINLTSEDTRRVGSFVAELKTYFDDWNIDKSNTFNIEIEEALTE